MNFIKHALIFLAVTDFFCCFARIDSHSDLTGDPISHLEYRFFADQSYKNATENKFFLRFLSFQESILFGAFIVGPCIGITGLSIAGIIMLIRHFNVI